MDLNGLFPYSWIHHHRIFKVQRLNDLFGKPLCVLSNKMIWYACAVQLLLTKAKIIIHSCNETDYNIMENMCDESCWFKIFQFKWFCVTDVDKTTAYWRRKRKKRILLIAFVLIVYRLSPKLHVLPSGTRKFKSSRINVIKWQ